MILGLGNPIHRRTSSMVCSFHKQVICSSCIIADSFGLLTGFLKLLKPRHSFSKLPLGIFDLCGQHLLPKVLSTLAVLEIIFSHA